MTGDIALDASCGLSIDPHRSFHKGNLSETVECRHEIMMIASGIYCLCTPGLTFLAVGWIIGFNMVADAIGNIFTTFDISHDNFYRLEVYGSEGTLYLPDPNTFGGPIKLVRGRSKEVIDLPVLYPYTENSRALGLADMAKAIQTGRKHRANSNQQLHVVETMLGFIKSSEEGRWVKIESEYERPELLKRDGLKGILD